MIDEMYEGDTIHLKFDFSEFKLPKDPDITFVIEVGDDVFIKKEVSKTGVVTLYEEDTIGLNGVYPCELRLNTKGQTLVFWQRYIRIRNSITITDEYKDYTSGGKKYALIVDRLTALENTEGMLIEAITESEIEKLF